MGARERAGRDMQKERVNALSTTLHGVKNWLDFLSFYILHFTFYIYLLLPRAEDAFFGSGIVLKIGVQGPDNDGAVEGRGVFGIVGITEFVNGIGKGVVAVGVEFGLVGFAVSFAPGVDGVSIFDAEDFEEGDAVGVEVGIVFFGRAAGKGVDDFCVDCDFHVFRFGICFKRPITVVVVKHAEGGFEVGEFGAGGDFAGVAADSLEGGEEQAHEDGEDGDGEQDFEEREADAPAARLFHPVGMGAW